MDYSFLAQDSTVVVTPQPGGFRGFFRPILRFFNPVYPRVVPVAPPCVPVPVPAGTLGRDSNGNLTVNGQTHCYTAPYAYPASNYPTYPTSVVRYGPVFYP